MTNEVGMNKAPSNLLHAKFYDRKIGDAGIRGKESGGGNAFHALFGLTFSSFSSVEGRFLMFSRNYDGRADGRTLSDRFPITPSNNKTNILRT